jgi:hypothetical protein
MKQLQLDDAQASMLREVLESYVSDLGMEIADTDSMDFRQSLKARKQFLTSVIEQLAG